MSEILEENNVVSLDEFRKRHPVASGILVRDPYSKKRIVQDKKATPVARSDAKKSSNRKLDEALMKYGSSTGNVMSKQYKKKVDLFDDKDE